MAYTTVANVAGMFPTFKRGISQQAPSDALIQTFMDDVTGEIDAVLQRRFATAISAYANFLAWVAALSTDAINTLEKINRYGAAAQLGDTLASFGVAAAREMAKGFTETYMEMMNELNARDANDQPIPAGRYDKLFDSLARTETPRPGFQAVPGGDQDERLKPSDFGQTNVFGKFDKRGT